nr:DUF3617 domain-containing protein [uncultured Sphingosinicella sp.]
MRSLVLLPLLVLAACSGGGDDAAATAKAKAEATKNLKLAAGQWETVAAVTKLTKQDQGAPAINTPEGTKTTGNHCVTQADADAKKPPAGLFAGEGYDCEYSNFYMSAGTLNAQLTCKREGLAGDIRMTVDGSYTAETIEANQSLSTFLSGTGDVNVQSKLTGRRTGAACAPTAEEAKA